MNGKNFDVEAEIEAVRKMSPVDFTKVKDEWKEMDWDDIVEKEPDLDKDFRDFYIENYIGNIENIEDNEEELEGIYLSKICIWGEKIPTIISVRVSETSEKTLSEKYLPVVKEKLEWVIKNRSRSEFRDIIFRRLERIKDILGSNYHDTYEFAEKNGRWAFMMESYYARFIQIYPAVRYISVVLDFDSDCAGDMNDGVDLIAEIDKDYNIDSVGW